MTKLSELSSRDLADVIYAEHMQLVVAASSIQNDGLHGVEHDELIHAVFNLGVAVSVLYQVRRGHLTADKVAVPLSMIRGIMPTLEYLRGQYVKEKATE